MHTACPPGRQAISIASTRERTTDVSDVGLKKSQHPGIREYLESTGSLVIRRAYAQMRWRHSMTKCSLLSMAVILSTAIAAPVFAQAVTQEPGAYALYLPHADLGIGSAPSKRPDVSVVSHGTADAMASAPSVRPWMAGNETATRPWSAPVGHHQPRAADLSASTSASQRIFDQEDANVDRIVRSVCRGC
jgi:hypothetical protein